MDLLKMDKNFRTENADIDAYDWYDIQSELFSLHGVYFDENEKIFTRMDKESRESVSAHVGVLATYTAGGRIRFRTNTPYIAIYSTQPCALNPNKGTLVNYCGFSYYANGVFCGATCPNPKGIYIDGQREFSYDGVIHVRYDIVKTEKIYDAEIYFPLYNGVNSIKIGIKKGSMLEKAKPYTYERPVVFYGSSITHGGCASRPGTDYVNKISRMLDCDIMNFGFTGNAKGEENMARYMANIKASVYVLDYDYNAPSVEHLEKTHEPFYKKLREKNPDTPVVFISSPNPRYRIDGAKRFETIKRTYENAVKNGEKVALIDGTTFFGENDLGDCTVDGVHPSDLGFDKMTKVIAPVIEKFLIAKK